MQRGGRAARCLREFGDMDLDTTVQEVEAESKHTVDGDLPYPRDMQRDEDEPGCGKCAAGDHQMALAHMGDESRNRERIENATHRERGDQQSRDRRLRLADGKKQQRHVREESMDSKNTDVKQTLARGSAKIPRKLAITAARLKRAGGCVTTPRKAKNAAIVTINPNEPRIANTPRQPSRSPMTPAMEEPTRLPVRPTASSRPIATWR